MNKDGRYEDTDSCPEKNCNGVLEYARESSCSCHIDAPCTACVESVLTCNECGWEEPEE